MQNTNPSPPWKRFSKEFLIIFLSIFCVIIVGGWYFYSVQKNRVTQAQYRELAAIADLKVEQIEAWRRERRMDGEIIFNSPLLVDHVEDYLQARGSAALGTTIHHQMKAMLQYGDYLNIYLLDGDAKIRLAVSDEKKQLGAFAFSAAREAIRNRRAVISDLHLNKPSGAIHIDIIVPLVSIRTGAPRAIGAVILQIDPDRYLYPMIKSWPTPSPSGETLLVRREGKDILYLNDLRHKENTALTLKMSAEEQSLPAALAVRGYTGIVEGIDYRGVSVLAAVRRIPDTNWFLISKIDMSEVFAPVLKQASYIAVIALLMIITTGAITGVLWQREHVSQYRLLYASEMKQQDSEARYKSLYDESLDCIFRVDDKGLIAMTNRAGAEMFGFQSPEEVIGSPAVRLWADLDEREKFFTVLQRDKVLKGYPIRAKRRAGEIIHLEVSCHLLEDKQGNSLGLEGILRDITERKGLEEQLLQAQKIEAVGTLAGGVAHDFNNILTAIIGYTHVVLMKIKKDDPLRYELQQVLAAADRAAMLTQSLLAFSRKQMVHLAPIEVNDVLKKFGTFLHRLIREDIEISTTTSSDELMVLADKGQIEQALMNLVTNAQDAMPNGGRLFIETGRCNIDDSFIAAHGYGKPGAYALISISDTGIGMDAQTKQKIFEPFFTTKEVGKGTGLGLALVYGTVKKHDGFTTVYSELGRGTTFKIYLPLTDRPLEKTTRPSALENAPFAGGTETILVAEDDEALRTMTISILSNAGYQVIVAVDGMDAVQEFTEHKDSVKLALLDVIMPKKNGHEVYKELVAMSPDLKVILMSGYTEDVFDSNELRGENVSFLMKPVSPDELLTKIRSMLNKEKEGR